MPFPSLYRCVAVATVFALALGLGACGRGERSIAETRMLPERERAVHLDATSAQRFGEGGHSHEGHAHGEASAAPAGNPFRWEKPAGWEELASTSMRVANFRFGDGAAGECYLTALPGSGGGTTANINRWRSQMGAPPLSEDEISALPTTTLLSQPAPMATVDGVFSGMGGGAPKEGYRLLGAILSYEQFTLFVKMTGPADVVKEEEENFKLFCASLRIVSPGGGSNP